MKIEKITQNINSQNQKTNQTPNFKGIGDFIQPALNIGATGLRFLDVNQAWGATAVDLGCMVAPRTITDFGRGPSAGFETMRREGSGTVNHAAIGLAYGPLAGLILGQALNSKYGIKAGSVYADANAIDVMSKFHFNNVKSAQNLSKETLIEEYVKNIADNISVNGEKNLSNNAKNEFMTELKNLINGISTKGDKLKSIALSDLGQESDIILKNGNQSIKLKLEDMIDNIRTYSKTLFSDKVLTDFKNARNFESVNFVKSMKKFGLNRSLLGLGIGTAIGCSIQPINIYLTKKKTGSDGFVGGEGRSKDNSAGFKALKAIAGAAFAAFAFLSIGKPKNFLKNIQYKSIFPTLEQFKLVYGATIVSRLLVARDKDELRESLVKDTIGFSSWLLLGNFVAKGTLKALDKTLKGKTRDEILYTALKKLGISTIENGKALNYKQLLAKLPKNNPAQKQLRYFSIAQLAGYLFSAVVLGVGVPKLNIYMTKQSEKKRAAQKKVNVPVNDILKPENIAFLKDKMSFTSNKMLAN